MRTLNPIALSNKWVIALCLEFFFVVNAHVHDSLLHLRGLPAVTNIKQSRKYCCICSYYRGKIIDGQEVFLHMYIFPANPVPRHICNWIQRSKLIRKDFVYTDLADAFVSFCWHERTYTTSYYTIYISYQSY